MEILGASSTTWSISSPAATTTADGLPTSPFAPNALVVALPLVVLPSSNSSTTTVVQLSSPSSTAMVVVSASLYIKVLVVLPSFYLEHGDGGPVGFSLEHGDGCPTGFCFFLDLCAEFVTSGCDQAC